MNKKVLHTLEYYKIIDLLKNKASSDEGRALCDKLRPLDDIDAINSMQEQTQCAMRRLFAKGDFPLSNIFNISPSLKRLEIGGTLNSMELLGIANILELTKRIKTYSTKDNSDLSSDCLDELFDNLTVIGGILSEIRRCISSEDEFYDDASDTLKNIRRRMASVNNRIHSLMNEMLTSSTVRDSLQDTVITMRGGRYCLSVRSDAKNKVPGIICDQSSKGSTLFIEPMAVAQLNNDLKQLESEELEEIEVILKDLSLLCAKYIPELKANHDTLIELDFIFARANLAMDMNAVRPILTDKKVFSLRAARHPLLNPKSVVPIDIYLGYEFNQLIITGPNTGGKTVSLKTAGLLCLMAQSGLHIPTGDRSKVGVFTQIYADIGDEQSIEQSLSTFSSHMTNLVYILKKAKHNSLVLLDELCSGTDPAEGAALATAILERLHNNNIPTLATTHYSEIKSYALSTNGVQNACCEFNVETLSPTYVLKIGIPGKSNAFAISKKLHLPTDIIEDAKSKMTKSDLDFEKLLTDLERTKAKAENEKVKIETYKREIATLKNRLSQKEVNLENRKEKIIQQANEQATKILQEAKDLADKTIRDFNKYGAKGDIKKMEQQRSQVGGKIKDLYDKSSSKPKKKSPSPKASSLHVGDKVRVISLGLTGTIHTLPNNKGDLSVNMGILNSTVNIEDIEKIAEAEVFTDAPVKKSFVQSSVNKSMSISPEINLLGKTKAEALMALDKYIDDAILSHLNEIRIVHGKGSGALRSAVQDYLKKSAQVDSYRLGEFGEGDSGVTIATLK